MRKTIYISGPMTAPTRWKVEQNCRHLQEVGLRLIREGWFAIVPVWFGDYLTKEDDISQLEDIIITSDCEIVKRSDAIFMCRGWKDSKGAMRELIVAKEANIQIYYEEE